MWLPWSCLHRVRVAPTAPCGRRKHRRGRGRRWCRRQPPDPTLRPWPPRPTPCPGCRPGRAGGLCWQPPRTSVQPASGSGSLAAFLTFRRNSCDRLPRGRAAKQALATISASHSWASSTATGPARTSTRAPQAAPLCIYAGGPLGRDSVSPVRRRGHQAFTLPLQVARLALLRTHRSEPAVLDRRRVSTSGGEMRRSSEMETTVSTEMGSGWLGVGSRVVGLRRPACSFTVALSSCRQKSTPESRPWAMSLLLSEALHVLGRRDHTGSPAGTGGKPSRRAGERVERILDSSDALAGVLRRN